MSSRPDLGTWRERAGEQAGAQLRALPDEARFAIGTLTRVPVPPPAALDRDVAGRGLALGPGVGAALGLVSGAVLLTMDADLVARLLSATIVVAIAAWLTRGLHWDGLADVADGLGSGAHPPQARAIMARSDIGPFGVLVLVLTLLLQILSIAQLPAGAPALAGWVLAMTLGRLAVAAACGPWARAARPEGLGALVAGAVTPAGLGVATIVTLGVAVLAARLGPLPWSMALLWAPQAALGTAAVVSMLARRRFEGITGDVLGATVELSVAAALLAQALR